MQGCVGLPLSSVTVPRTARQLNEDCYVTITKSAYDIDYLINSFRYPYFFRPIGEPYLLPLRSAPSHSSAMLRLSSVSSEAATSPRSHRHIPARSLDAETRQFRTFLIDCLHFGTTQKCQFAPRPSAAFFGQQLSALRPPKRRTHSRISKADHARAHLLHLTNRGI